MNSLEKMIVMRVWKEAPSKMSYKMIETTYGTKNRVEYILCLKLN